jgi:hypothetical protein
MAKAKLNDEVKTYIAQALVCFDSPSAFSAFVLDVSRRLLQSRDPNRKAASALAGRLSLSIANLWYSYLRHLLSDTIK